MIERLLYLYLELWRLRGFSTSIWMEGNQGASLPQNLGRLRGFSIFILNCDNQGASLPRSEWKVTKGLFYLWTWAIDWLLYLETWAIERFLYLNLELRRPRGFSTLEPGRSRGFSISILNCRDQGVSLPRFEWKVTKGFVKLWFTTMFYVGFIPWQKML